MKKRNALFLIAAAGLSQSHAADIPADQLEFFETKVRPILAENCYKCHSVEKGKSKGELTLDSREAAQKGGETGPAVVPGDPAKSLMIKAISYTDADLSMPPKSEGGRLSDDKIAVLQKWIEMGAPDPRDEVKVTKLTGLTEKARAHWAYQPVTKPAIPINKNQQWCRTPVDAFILQKLEAAGMYPSPDAEKETLLRRVYYDLVGLPPVPQEVEAFIRDTAPNAFEKVVDRLLASPHYGERWGRHWLDTARYADTSGNRNTNNNSVDYRYANAWTYRDYVIRALNEDKPYDQFILEQLAADALQPAETPAKKEPAKTEVKAPEKPAAQMLAANQKPAKAPATMTPATMTPMKPAPEMSMMGGDSMMMMGGGGSAGVQGPGQVPPSYAALGFLTVGERFDNPQDVINDRIDVISKGFLAMTVSCARCHDHMFDPISQKDYYALHGVLASISEPSEKPVISVKDPKAHAEFREAAAAIEAENRAIYFKEVEHWLSIFHAKPGKYLRVSVLRGSTFEEDLKEREKILDSEQLDGAFANYFARDLNDGNRVYGPLKKLMGVKESEFNTHGPLIMKELEGQRNRYNPLVLEAILAAKPDSLEAAIKVYEALFDKVASKWPGLVRSFEKGGQSLAPEDVEILKGPLELVSSDKATLEWIRRESQSWDNQMRARANFTFAKMNQLQMTHPGAPSRAMIVVDKPHPTNSPVFIRGQSGAPGEVVARRFLEVLSKGSPEPFKNGSGRLDLAKAIASKSNPLTARVMVNRAWMHHFGEGFVRTPDDLGTMSEPPSHPELLDYLSSYFMETGWSLKRLHKIIVLSRAYQASSHTRPDYEEKDPENRLLWRANVRRLDFEAIRDSLLSFGGQLDRKMGGQPVNITEEPYSFRRSIYGYIDRGNISELMSHFDFSDPGMPNSKRSTTVVPQQALFLMNSPLAVDVARKIIARPEFRSADTNLRRLINVYRILYQRDPKPAEVQVGMAFLEAEVKRQAEVGMQVGDLTKKNEEVQKVIEERKKRDNDGLKPIANDGLLVERKILNAWETYAQALLLANESAYVN